MGGKKGGENSKKVAGNARKEAAAAAKNAEADAKKSAVEDADWGKGAKGNAKKEAEAEKKAEAARKKAEREALLKEEEANTPGRPGPKNAKTAVKKTRGLDLSQLDNDTSNGKSLPSLNASGLDNALDALALTSGSNDKVEKHPERRFKAAYSAFEERRLAEMDADGSGQGLRLQQRKDKIRKEFEKSPENPFNQAHAKYDSNKDDLASLRQQEKDKVERRLGA